MTPDQQWLQKAVSEAGPKEAAAIRKMWQREREARMGDPAPADTTAEEG